MGRRPMKPIFISRTPPESPADKVKRRQWRKPTTAGAFESVRRLSVACESAWHLEELDEVPFGVLQRGNPVSVAIVARLFDELDAFALQTAVLRLHVVDHEAKHVAVGVGC